MLVQTYFVFGPIFWEDLLDGALECKLAISKRQPDAGFRAV